MSSATARATRLSSATLATQTRRSEIQTSRHRAGRIRRVLSDHAVFNLGPYVRRDAYNYYPSNNPLADRGPANLLQTSSITQARTLLNAGLHSDVSYGRGMHSAKAGVQYSQDVPR